MRLETAGLCTRLLSLRGVHLSGILARHPILPDVWLRLALHCLLLQGFEIQMPLEEEEQVREAWNKLAQLHLLLVAAQDVAWGVL